MKMFWIGLVVICLSITGIILSIIIPLGKPEAISEFSGFGFFAFLHLSAMSSLVGGELISKALDSFNEPKNYKGETKCQN
jgi:hypothetical protein